MHSLLKSFLMAAVLCSFVVVEAKADVFFVEDQNDRFTLTFPDTWKKADNQKPDDKLTVYAQGEYNFTSCRVRVREDRRFVIFPNEYADEVQRTQVSQDFWNNYLGEYDNVAIEIFKDDSGLGQGFASMVEASFDTAEGSLVHKRGIMFASIYHDQLYVVDCSSEESVYDEMRPIFLGIIKSVDFTEVINGRTQGHYRNFTDEEVEIEGPHELDKYKL